MSQDVGKARCRIAQVPLYEKVVLELVQNVFYNLPPGVVVIVIASTNVMISIISPAILFVEI
jgi:hypothetical protein